MPPVARPAIYDLYWRFAAERQLVFHRRARGETPPWTSDPIIGRYKFCNSFRASDRVSQYLIRHVIYGPAGAHLVPEDMFSRVILFRLFSRVETWEVLEEASGGVQRTTLQVERLASLLDEVRRRQPIYTSAFILSPYDAFGHKSKHRNHLRLVEEMFRPRRLGLQLAKASSLRQVYESLLAWPMIGPFMAYQMAIDLNYTDCMEFSEDDFTVPGPGAIRGIRKVFFDVRESSPVQLIARMVDVQEAEFARLQLDWQDLYGRRLHAIDAQGLFCEVDKYARVAFPELKSDRVRIKHEFRPVGLPLNLFYPPKWGINDRLPIRAGPREVAPDASDLKAQLELPEVDS
jgi:hypothetical protein